jgi:Mrp family chromosome partitioning ATPase
MGEVIALCSAKGAPGVSTCALALAAAWPVEGEMPVVIEADPAGGDVAARCVMPSSPGLVELASAHRRTVNTPGGFLEFSQPLPFRAAVCAGPVGAEPAGAAVELLARQGLQGLGRSLGGEHPILLDLGRLTERTRPLAEQADRVLVVSRGGVDALANAASVLGRLRQAVRPDLVIVGPTPYRTEEIAGAAGAERIFLLPYDARGAASLTGGAVRRRSKLLRAASVLADDVAADHAVPFHRSCLLVRTARPTAPTHAEVIRA